MPSGPASITHFTPTSASWLNLVERWFGLLTEKQLRRGVHQSSAELETAIYRYLDVTNEDPKPVGLDQDRRPNPGQRRPHLPANFEYRTLEVGPERLVWEVGLGQ